MLFVSFFDLPVYRTTEENYHAARKAHVDKVVFQIGTPQEGLSRKREEKDPHVNAALRHDLDTTYGGCWQFNEIIGHVRLYFDGSQVLGEYFGVVKRRIVRTRTKTLEWQTHKLAPEVDIEAPFGRVEILAAIRAYIGDCRQELPGRHIGTSVFDRLAPHIEWEKLL